MRNRFVLSVVCALVALIAWSASAQTVITQIPNPGCNDTLPTINDNGEMVWSSNDGTDWDLLYYDGASITRLLTPGCFDRFPQINNSGQIVWEGFDSFGWGIYLYDGIAITRISDPSVMAYGPQINDSGDVVWYASGRSGSSIYLYRNGVAAQISHPSYIDITPQINDNGNVVWVGYSYFDNDWDIYLYDGLTISRIEHLGFLDNMPAELNNIGDVAWASCDGTEWDINVFDGTTITSLSTPGCNDRVVPQINDAGQVTWCGFDGTDWEIFYFDGTVITQLTDNALDDMAPQINNDGQIAWSGEDGTDINGTDWEIFTYKDSVVTQLTDNDTDDSAPQLNNEGDVVWMGSDGTNGDIFVAETASDVTPPAISNVTATPNILWPPNHQMVPVIIQVTAADETDPAPISHIVSVACNESDDGDADWAIAGDLKLELRAERLGTGASRIYTITVECADASGNVSSSDITVTVPHDRSKK